MWHFRSMVMNCRLAGHGKDNGWTFADNWNRFYGRNRLPHREGNLMARIGSHIESETGDERNSTDKRDSVQEESRELLISVGNEEKISVKHVKDSLWYIIETVGFY